MCHFYLIVSFSLLFAYVSPEILVVTNYVALLNKRICQSPALEFCKQRVCIKEFCAYAKEVCVKRLAKAL
jgi:hypothetical protein